MCLCPILGSRGRTNTAGEWVKNVAAGSDQAKESLGAYGAQSVVQVQQLGECPAGRFYQHCNNNSSLPEGLMGLVLLVLIDLGWRPVLSPAQARRAGSVLQP